MKLSQFSKIVLVICISSKSFAGWEQTNFPKTASMRSLATNGNLIYAGSSTEYIYQSRDLGNTWDSTKMPSAYILSLHADENAIYAGTLGAMYISTDSSKNWKSLQINGDIIESVTTSDDTIYCGTARSGIYKKAKSGTEWIATDSMLQSMGIFAITTSNNQIFAGTEGKGVFSYKEGSGNWRPLGDSGLSYSWIESVTASEGYFYAGTDGGGVYRIKSNDSIWRHVGPAKTSVYSMTSFNEHIFMGTLSDGIYYSSDTGNSWSRIASQSPLDDVRALAIFQGYIFAATYSGGIWRRNLNEFSNLQTRITNKNLRLNSHATLLAATFKNSKISLKSDISTVATIRIFEMNGAELNRLNIQLTANTVTNILTPAPIRKSAIIKTNPSNGATISTRIATE